MTVYIVRVVPLGRQKERLYPLNYTITMRSRDGSLTFFPHFRVKLFNCYQTKNNIYLKHSSDFVSKASIILTDATN